MKESKSPLLILLSVLLLISAGLLVSTIYYYYYKMPDQTPVAMQVLKDSAAAAEITGDTAIKVYASKIKELDSSIDSTWKNTDSIKSNLDIRLSEFYKLRDEVVTVLKSRGSNADLEKARQKIEALQNRIDALHYTNIDVERENKRLLALISQLKENKGKANFEYPSNEVIDNKAFVKPVTNTNPASSALGKEVFSLNDLCLSAFKMNNAQEQETTSADETEKLTATFKVNSKNLQNANSEVMIVVLQPDGKVVQNSSWDGGSFQTPEGKRIYSGKLRIDNSKGDVQQMHFTFTPDKYMPGNYVLRIYHKGQVVGELVKKLS